MKGYIDKETFYKAFDIYVKDLYSDELIINSFTKILDALDISYPSRKERMDEYDINEK